VTAANAAGTTTAASDPKLLTPAYEPPLGPTNPTVDVRVTGIEMTQAWSAPSMPPADPRSAPQ
jgi:hypothetical protein